MGWILLSVGVAIAGGAYLRHSTPPTAWTSLVGQCATLESFDRLTASTAVDQSPEPRLATVDCSGPHDVEIFAAVNPNGRGLFLTEWPGEDSVKDQTRKACGSKFASYIGLPYGESEFEGTFWSPNEQGWELGIHTSLCA
ncbi:MAG: hypothetical protein GX446_13685, partial [Chthonomonadales bacterium]|nr:hypothetical protein [Chthonomonadales bacterium]